MKISNLTNLWVGYNKIEDFRILIIAYDEETATEAAIEYFCDSGMEAEPSYIEITEFTNTNIKFDCDYAITSNDIYPVGEFNYSDVHEE